MSAKHPDSCMMASMGEDTVLDEITVDLFDLDISAVSAYDMTGSNTTTDCTDDGCTRTCPSRGCSKTCYNCPTMACTKGCPKE